VRWLLALLAVVAWACAPPHPSHPTVVMWFAYDGPERIAFEAEADRFRAEHPGIELRLESVPSDAFADKITAAIPNGNGPDLFVFAHDRIGGWVEARLLEPIEFFVDESLADRFDLQPINAMAYQGSLYGLPLAVKSLALFYRTDLVPSPPATTDDLFALAKGLPKGVYPLVYDSAKLYSHAAWLHGFGGDLFDESGKLTIATPAAAAAAKFAHDLIEDGIVPAETTGTLVSSMFQDGRAAMAFSGPWFVGSLAPGTPFAVAPMPVVSATGKPAAPFLGAEGILMSARASDKRAAFLVMEAFTSDASAIRRAVAARQVVPNRAAYDDPRVAGDAVLTAFRRQAQVARPMPSIPAMRSVWTPYDNALQRIIGQGSDPMGTLSAAESEIRGYVEAEK
jgi:arabinogalactan oligomer/maltooligosaccharide transport system substrate-binding protein